MTFRTKEEHDRLKAEGKARLLEFKHPLQKYPLSPPEEVRHMKDGTTVGPVDEVEDHPFLEKGH